MADEIILHVGIHKTGTSSIQQTLFEESNNEFLKKEGFVYPIKWPNNHSIPVFSAFCEEPQKYHINVRAKYTEKQILEVNQKYLNDFKNETNQYNSSNIIISGEDISLLSKKGIERFKRYLEENTSNENFKVVVYVRHPVSWAISAIQQMIKGGRTKEESLHIVKKATAQLYRNRIEKFIEIFGKNNVFVYDFDLAKNDEKGLVGHFLSSIGVNKATSSKIESKNTNESISNIAADLISFINERIPLFQNGKIHEKRENGDIRPLLNIYGQKFDLSDKEKYEIYNENHNDMKWLLETTGINYTTETFQPMEELFIGDKSKESLLKSYQEVNFVIKSLMYEYIVKKLT